MKKFFALLLCAVMFGAIPFASALAEFKFIATDNGDAAALRATMDVNGDIICEMPYGSAVEVIRVVYNTPWIECNYNGYHGYVNARAISATPPAPMVGNVKVATVKAIAAPVPETTVQNSATYTDFAPAHYAAIARPATEGGSVQIHWAPTTDSNALGDYQEGAELWVLYSNGTWCQVFDPNNFTAGYVMTQYLTYTAPISSAMSASNVGGTNGFGG